MDEDRDVERTKVGSFFIVYFQGNVINAFLFFFFSEERMNKGKFFSLSFFFVYYFQET